MEKTNGSSQKKEREKSKKLENLNYSEIKVKRKNAYSFCVNNLDDESFRRALFVPPNSDRLQSPEALPTHFRLL